MYHVQVTTSTIYVYTLDVQTLLYLKGTLVQHHFYLVILYAPIFLLF